jgi:hypothetical protein
MMLYYKKQYSSDGKDSVSVALKKKIAVALALLPPEDLLKWVKTTQQLKCWQGERLFHTYVSQCWSALHQGKADPLQPLLSSSAIDKNTHTTIWLTTYVFEDLWELIQISFHHIQPTLTELGCGEILDSPYKLFIFAAYEISEETFSVCLKPYHEVSAGKYIKQHKLLNKFEKGELKPQEQKTLESQVRQDFQLTAIWFVVAVCKTKATSREKLLKAKLDDFLNAVDRLAAHEVTQTRKVGSFAWKNGEKVKASKYGGTY